MYRLGVLLTVFALVMNGAAGYAWADASGHPGMEMQVRRGDITPDAQSHHRHARAVVAVATDAGHGHGLAHKHRTCCGRCNVVTLLPGFVAVPVTLAFNTVSFRAAPTDLAGHLIVVDPGIPKPVV